MQPATGALPMWKMVVSMPAFSSSEATSVSAAQVQPFACGLPLISRTFIQQSSSELCGAADGGAIGRTPWLAGKTGWYITIISPMATRGTLSATCWNLQLRNRLQHCNLFDNMIP